MRRWWLEVSDASGEPFDVMIEQPTVHAEGHHLIEVTGNPLNDPAAMARATEALQVSADMPHDRRAAYIIGAALNPGWQS